MCQPLFAMFLNQSVIVFGAINLKALYTQGVTFMFRKIYTIKRRLIKINFATFILLFLFCQNKLEQNFEINDPFDFGKLKGEIEKEFKLAQFESHLIDSNLVKYVVDTSIAKFETYYVEDFYKNVQPENESYFKHIILGFYNDLLIYKFISSDELEYNAQGLDENRKNICLMFLESECSQCNGIKLIRKNTYDGNILGEGGWIYCKQISKELREVHICVADIENPQHQQFLLISKNIEILDSLENVPGIMKKCIEKVSLHSLFSIRVTPERLIVANKMWNNARIK